MKLTQDIDIDALLAERSQIAIIWCIDDVQAVRPNLTDDQAWEVLQAVKRRHDAELGISWLTLALTADWLYPDANGSDQMTSE